MIDTINLVKFGTMTSGAGLAAVFDSNLATTGYAQSVVGYAGVVLAQPTRIGKVEVTSATNGLDASGATTGIELRLYGKNAMPSNADDGTLLASTSFTDQNVQRTITLESVDIISSFTHVWVKIHTGVWAVAAEVKFYEETGAIPEIEPLGPGSHLMMKSCNDSVPLTHSFSELPQFRIRFRLDTPRIALFDFHADVVHVGTGSDVDKPVGYSFRIVRRQGKDLATLNSSAFQNIDHAVGGGNVSELNPQHYGNKTIPSGAVLDAGYHEIGILGSGHTSATATLDLLRMLVEGGKGLNCLRVTVLP